MKFKLYFVYLIVSIPTKSYVSNYVHGNQQQRECAESMECENTEKKYDINSI